MTFSENKALRGMGDTITRLHKEGLRTDLEPAEANRACKFYSELYEAALAHPDWACDGERAGCADYYSPQNTPGKLLKWYRTKRDAL